VREWVRALIHEEIDAYMIPLVAEEIVYHDQQLRAELPALIEQYVRHDPVAARANLERQHDSIAQCRQVIDFVAHKQRNHGLV
jgi:hypothetical protein